MSTDLPPSVAVLMVSLTAQSWQTSVFPLHENDTFRLRYGLHDRRYAVGGGAFCLHRDMSVNLEPLTICSVSVHYAMFDAKGSLSRKGGRVFSAFSPLRAEQP